MAIDYEFIKKNKRIILNKLSDSVDGDSSPKQCTLHYRILFLAELIILAILNKITSVYE